MRSGEAVLISSAQILALVAGISRSGVTMVAGMFRGLSHEDAAGSRSRSPAFCRVSVPTTGADPGPLLPDPHPDAFGVYCLIAGLASITDLELMK